MSLQMPKVGDRYESWGARITVSSVDTDEMVVQLRIFDPISRATRFEYQQLPLPDSYRWVGNADSVLICERCTTQPAAMGMAYCDDCIDTMLGGGV